MLLVESFSEFFISTVTSWQIWPLNVFFLTNKSIFLKHAWALHESYQSQPIKVENKNIFHELDFFISPCS